MMTRRLELEDFTSPEIAGESAQPDDDGFEEIKLQSFEQGYKAGWDDALAAQEDAQTRLRREVGNSLQEIAFTHEEARAQLLRGVAPLLHDMAARVLPVLARETLGATVAEAMAKLAEGAVGAPLAIAVNPEARAAVAAYLAEVSALQFDLVDDPALTSGQAVLRLGEREREIDLDRAIAEIETAVAEHFAIQNHEEAQHG